jgi:hypothetical protein
VDGIDGGVTDPAILAAAAVYDAIEERSGDHRCCAPVDAVGWFQPNDGKTPL